MEGALFHLSTTRGREGPAARPCYHNQPRAPGWRWAQPAPFLPTGGGDVPWPPQGGPSPGPLGEGALSAQRGPGWQVVHQSLAMPAEEGGLGTFRGPSPSQRVAATGLQAPKTLAYLLMGGVGDTRDLLPPHPQDPSPRWSCRTPPSQTRSSPQRRSPGRPGCGQGSPGVARAAGTAAG